MVRRFLFPFTVGYVVISVFLLFPYSPGPPPYITAPSPIGIPESPAQVFRLFQPPSRGLVPLFFFSLLFPVGTLLFFFRVHGTRPQVIPLWRFFLLLGRKSALLGSHLESLARGETFYDLFPVVFPPSF